MKNNTLVAYLVPILFLILATDIKAQEPLSTNSSLKQDTMNVNQKKVVLMGNSITEMWPGTRPDFFKSNPFFIVKGIGGQTSDQMLGRFEKDVINLKPVAVVILAGINDIAENNGPISLADIMKNITSMAEMAQEQGIKVVLCTLVPANRFTWRPSILPAEKVIILNSMITTYAAEKGITLVNYYDSLVDDAQGLREDLGPDGVHPNAKGYAIMEQLLLEGLSDVINGNR